MADLLDHGCAEAMAPSLWPEDTVEYRVYCLPAALEAAGGGLDPRSSSSALEDALSRLAVECNHVCKRLSGDHVWHYAALYLSPEIGGVCVHACFIH